MAPRASFSASKLRSSLAERGVVRPCRFMAHFVLPPALASGQLVRDEIVKQNQLDMWCEAASLPGVALEYYPVRRYGYGAIENKPFAPKFTDVELRFRLDAKGIAYEFMHSWMRLACNYDHAGTIGSASGAIPNQHVYELGYKDDYKTDVMITQYNDAGDSITTVVLREAYPVYVGNVPLNWASSSEYSQLPVTLTFIGWYTNTGPVAGTNVDSASGRLGGIS